MKRLLPLFVLLAALPLAAQSPTEADFPPKNTSEICEPLVCERIDAVHDLAITNLELALAALAATDETLRPDILKLFEGLERKRRMNCPERDFDEERALLDKILREIRRRGGTPPNGLEPAAKWLEVSKAWEEAFKKCFAQRKPDFPAQSFFDVFPNVDFERDMPADDLRRLLEQLTNAVRKNTRELLLSPDRHVRCSEHNRRIILDLIRSDGRLR